jgi:hypothetical protein
LAENGVRARKPDIRAERELATTAKCVTVDGGDNGLGIRATAVKASCRGAARWIMSRWDIAAISATSAPAANTLGATVKDDRLVVFACRGPRGGTNQLVLSL